MCGNFWSEGRHAVVAIGSTILELELPTAVSPGLGFLTLLCSRRLFLSFIFLFVLSSLVCSVWWPFGARVDVLLPSFLREVAPDAGIAVTYGHSH